MRNSFYLGKKWLLLRHFYACIICHIMDHKESMMQQHFQAWIIRHIIYHKIKKSTSLRYFDTYFMQNIGIVSDRRWHDFLSIYYADKESCHRQSLLRLTFWSYYSTCKFSRNICKFWNSYNFQLHINNSGLDVKL